MAEVNPVSKKTPTGAGDDGQAAAAAWPGAAFGLSPGQAESLTDRDPLDGLRLRVDPWRGLPPSTAAVLGGLDYLVTLADADVKSYNLSAALRAVHNHASNDFRNLLDHVADCDGRSAAMCARSLHDHIANAQVLKTDPDAEARYLDHRWVTDELLGTMSPGVDLLAGKKRRKAKTRFARMLAKATNHLNTVRGKHPKGWERDWRNTTAKQALKAAGVPYEPYRILSATIHGAFGGLWGNLKDMPDGAVFRVGPNLELASFAYLTGIDAFSKFVHLTHRGKGLYTADLLDNLERARRAWPDVDAALQKEDKAIWPRNAASVTPNASLILGLHPGGVARWYFHDRISDRISKAHPPDDADDLLQIARQKYAEDGFDPDQSEGRPMTFECLGVHPAHVDGAPWFPPLAVLNPSDERPKNPNMRRLSAKPLPGG
ncbi:MAG: hypothetical protein LBO20_01570 [Bifidobacteriaceae bacterium]|nr:hypothetical protein [Bifidobacteriaceae bacterium]